MLGAVRGAPYFQHVHEHLLSLGVPAARHHQAGEVVQAVDAQGDLTGDGAVNISDLGEVLALFGTSCV